MIENRINRAELDGVANVVSRMLNDGLHVVTERHSQKMWLYLHDNSGRVRMLTGGTMRECWVYLQGMYRALDIIGR